MDVQAVNAQTVLTMIGALTACIALMAVWCRNPFKYPYFDVKIDITGRRQPKSEDCIDEYLCDADNRQAVREHHAYVQQWEKESLEHIERSTLKHHRLKQYEAIVDDEHEIRIELVRQRTKYKQRDYVRYPYIDEVSDRTFSMPYSSIVKRQKALEKIGYETTIRKYKMSNQRKLMTKKLREEIMERDNYTCQICGKYMPDRIGLQIDHIVPVSKGGKTVPSNLRVLCSRCNGHKGNRM